VQEGFRVVNLCLLPLYQSIIHFYSQINYKQLYYGIILIFRSWVFIKLLQSCYGFISLLRQPSAILLSINRGFWICSKGYLLVKHYLESTSMEGSKMLLLSVAVSIFLLAIFVHSSTTTIMFCHLVCVYIGKLCAHICTFTFSWFSVL